MAMTYTVESVRRDLRGIARKNVHVETLTRTRQYLLSQIALAKETGKDTAELEKQLASALLALKRLLAETAESEARYIVCVCALSPLHRTLIFEHYVHGLEMWKVAEKVGYSERQANEHLKQALKRLTELLNSKGTG